MKILQICKFALCVYIVLIHGNVVWFTYCRYVPTCTVTRNDLRQLQQIYSERNSLIRRRLLFVELSIIAADINRCMLYINNFEH